MPFLNSGRKTDPARTSGGEGGSMQTLAWKAPTFTEQKTFIHVESNDPSESPTLERHHLRRRRRVFSSENNKECNFPPDGQPVPGWLLPWALRTKADSHVKNWHTRLESMPAAQPATALLLWKPNVAMATSLSCSKCWIFCCWTPPRCPPLMWLETLSQTILRHIALLFQRSQRGPHQATARTWLSYEEPSLEKTEMMKTVWDALM